MKQITFTPKLFRILLSLVLVISLAGSAVLAHDHHTHDVEYELEQIEDVSLEDWDGEWKNMVYYLEDESCQEALDALADAYEHTPEEYLDQAIADSVNFFAMKVDGESAKITFLSRQEDEEVEESYTCTYAGSVKFEHGHHSGYWHVFETDAEEEDLETLFLMEVHGEEVLAHFHLRIGHEIEDLLIRDSWWPTFVAADTPAEIIADNYLARAERHINTEVELETIEDISLADWEGKWNNMIAYLSEAELADQVEELAEEHELSVEDYIAEEKAESVPFARIEVDGEENLVRFFKDKDAAGEDAEDDGEEIYSAGYEYLGSIPEEHGGSTSYWHVFKATDEDAKFVHLALMEVHGEENLAHFHLRAAKRLVNIAAAHDYPTFVSEDTPIEMIAEELVEHAHAHGHGHDHDHDHDHDHEEGH